MQGRHVVRADARAAPVGDRARCPARARASGPRGPARGRRRAAPARGHPGGSAPPTLRLHVTAGRAHERARARVHGAGRPARDPQPARGAGARLCGLLERGPDRDHPSGLAQWRPATVVRVTLHEGETRLRGAQRPWIRQLRTSNRRARSSRRSSRRWKRATCTLEKALELYERGVQLSRFCHSKLEEAERRLEILNERGELRPAPRRDGPDAVRRERQVPVTAPSPLAGLARPNGASSWSEALDRYPAAPANGRPAIIAEAMRYSLFAGGKRLRPMLVLAAAEAAADTRRPRSRRRCGPGAARGLRHRADSHLLAGARRSSGHGQRHAAARPADRARRVRRRHGNPVRRCAADRGVRAAGARAAIRRRSRRLPRPSSPGASWRRIQDDRRGRGRAWHGRRPGPRSRRRPSRVPRPSARSACGEMHARKTGALLRASAVAGAVMAGAPRGRGRGDRRLRHARRAGVPDRRRHSRRRRRVGGARQDRRQGCRRRQADVSGAVRPRGVAGAAPRRA